MGTVGKFKCQFLITHSIKLQNYVFNIIFLISTWALINVIV